MFKFLLILAILPFSILASDHDDGEMDLKGRALNITDVYAFREDWQSGQAAHKGNLIVIMNVNPRSLPSQQYYFSDKARYNIHLTRNSVDSKAQRPTGREDIRFQVEFSPPSESDRQSITVTTVLGTEKIVANTDLLTTPLSASAAPLMNTFSVKSKNLNIFAGLREDPFFFDVEQFFKLRAGKVSGFLPASDAKDFTHKMNVLSIVMRIPLTLINAGNSNNSVFDVWTTISIPK